VKTAQENFEAERNTLGDMSTEEFRRFGHEIVDWIANYFERIEQLPVLAQIEPGDLKANRWKQFSGTLTV
jgi:aromatic-L-amino-acid decarboxylase